MYLTRAGEIDECRAIAALLTVDAIELCAPRYSGVMNFIWMSIQPALP
jgi:hypothetical protein